ncbi:MAG: WD40 repeat domain-containing protein [Planctomycetia bacterium]|nr:WD40 repeat domain-containing protein [Planctomycetia bacterium]
MPKEELFIQENPIQNSLPGPKKPEEMPVLVWNQEDMKMPDATTAYRLTWQEILWGCVTYGGGIAGVLLLLYVIILSVQEVLKTTASKEQSAEMIVKKNEIRERCVLLIGNGDAVTALAVTPDGRFIVTGGGKEDAIFQASSSGSLWDLGSEEIWESPNTSVLEGDLLTERVPSVLGENSEKERIFMGKVDGKQKMAFLKKPLRYLTGSREVSPNYFYSWKVPDWRKQKDYREMLLSQAGGAAGSADQDLKVAPSAILDLLDGFTEKSLWELNKQIFQQNVLNREAAAKRGTENEETLRELAYPLIIWDMETLRPVQVFWKHASPITSVVISPSGNKMITTDLSGNAIFWQLRGEKGQFLKERQAKILVENDSFPSISQETEEAISEGKSEESSSETGQEEYLPENVSSQEESLESKEEEETETEEETAEEEEAEAETEGKTEEEQLVEAFFSERRLLDSTDKKAWEVMRQFRERFYAERNEMETGERSKVYWEQVATIYPDSRTGGGPVTAYYDAAFSPSGKQFVLCGSALDLDRNLNPYGESGVLVLWDIENWCEVTRYRENVKREGTWFRPEKPVGCFRSVVFSADGNYLLAGASGKNAGVYAFSTSGNGYKFVISGKERKLLAEYLLGTLEDNSHVEQDVSGHEFPEAALVRVTISADGSRVVSVDEMGRMFLWKFNAPGGQCLAEVGLENVFTTSVREVIYSHDKGFIVLIGEQTAFCDGLKDEIKFLGNMNFQTDPPQVFFRPNFDVTSGCFSPDMKYFVLGCSDGNIRIWPAEEIPLVVQIDMESILSKKRKEKTENSEDSTYEKSIDDAKSVMDFDEDTTRENPAKEKYNLEEINRRLQKDSYDPLFGTGQHGLESPEM